MLHKRNIGVVSFFSIIALISVGFSSFNILPIRSVSINISTGGVINLNECVTDKLISYSLPPSGYSDNTSSTSSSRNTTNTNNYYYYYFNIGLSFKFYTYQLQNSLEPSGSTYSFTIYIDLYDEEGLLSNIESLYENDVLFYYGSGCSAIPSIDYSNYVLTIAESISFTTSNLTTDTSYLDFSILITLEDNMYSTITSSTYYKNLEDKECFSFYVRM